MNEVIENLKIRAKNIDYVDLLKEVESKISIGFERSFFTSFKPDGFYRARSHTDVLGNVSNGLLFPFLSEKEFWNRRATDIDYFGRCNSIGESYLYCSTDLSTAIIESKPKEGQFVSVTSFELINSNFPGSRFGFIGEEYLAQIPSISHLFKNFKLNEEFREIDNLLDELFHINVVSENVHLYKLSSAVTDCVMRNVTDGKNELQTQGMIYSSIERDKKNFNMIYRPEHARQNFYITKIETFKVIDNNKESIQLSLRRIGITSGSKVVLSQNFDVVWQDQPNIPFIIFKGDY